MLDKELKHRINMIPRSVEITIYPKEFLETDWLHFPATCSLTTFAEMGHKLNFNCI